MLIRTIIFAVLAGFVALAWYDLRRRPMSEAERHQLDRDMCEW